MKTVELLVRDTERSVVWSVEPHIAEVIVGAVSADPTTIDELLAAICRFVDPGRLKEVLPPPVECLPLDDQGDIRVIDLPSRLIVFPDPPRSATLEVPRIRDLPAKDGTIRVSLGPTWEWTPFRRQWPQLAEERRAAREQQNLVVARQVLTGEPLLEHLVKGCAAVPVSLLTDVRRSLRDRPGRSHQKLKVSRSSGHYVRGRRGELSSRLIEIHRQWLMTARADLNDRSPRSILIDSLPHLEADLDSRQQQWTREGECPVGLADDARAVAEAAFGPHEFTLYFWMIRFLLWSQVEELSRRRKRTFRGMIDHLMYLRDEWLDTPADEELAGFTPREVIRRERLRLPLRLSSEQAMIDCDCPICQMIADNPNPQFLFLDPPPDDDGFEFSAFQDLDDWQNCRADDADFDSAASPDGDWFGSMVNEAGGDAMNRRRRSRASDPTTDGPSNQFSLVTISPRGIETSVMPFAAGEGDNPEASLRNFKVGSLLGELINRIRHLHADPLTITALNGQFRAWRMSGEDTSDERKRLAQAFCEALDDVASDWPSTAPLCAKIQTELIEGIAQVRKPR